MIVSSSRWSTPIEIRKLPGQSELLKRSCFEYCLRRSKVLGHSLDIYVTKELEIGHFVICREQVKGYSIVNLVQDLHDQNGSPHCLG